MASNTSRPEGLRKIGSTVEDSVNRVSIVDYFNIDRGVATFRGIEGGSGITVSLVDADGSPNTNGKVLRITGSGSGGSGTPGAVWFAQAGAPAGALGADGDMYLNTTNSDYFQKTAGAWAPKGNLQGIQGPAGAAGAQGPQGIQGPVGPAGADGAQGIQGPVGPAGADGVDGAQGIQGPAGPAGNDGAPGAPGAAGAQGPQGIQGIQGEIGPQGPAGPTGPKGDTGDQGIQGPAGIQGPQGIQGPAGPQGVAGADGQGIQIKGALAAEGDLPGTGNAAGDAYVIGGDLWVWDGSAWINAGPFTGPEGPQGIQGIQGPAGAEGPQGPVGPQGPAGADGATGPVGPQGPQGIQGVQGPVGPAGADGVDGAQGPKGDKGDQGDQGIQGIQGVAGPAGNDGADGADGVDGVDGAGVPVGGTAGQILAKIDGTDFNTEWIDAPSGGGASVTVTDTNSVDLTLSGANLSAAVKRSATAGNALTENADGLYVATPAAGLTSVNSTDSTTIDFTGNGTSGSALVAAVKVSSAAGNALETRSGVEEGLFVAAAAGGSVVTSNSTSITLTGNGTAGTPLSAAATISPNANNALTNPGNGLFVATPTAYTASDTNSFDLNLTGSAFSGSVKRSTAVANNRITEQSDGLHVAPVAVQDEGAATVANPTAINFTGAGVTVTNTAGVATVTIPGGGGGGGLETYSFKITYASNAITSITDVTAGITVTNSGTTITVTHGKAKMPVIVNGYGVNAANTGLNLKTVASGTFILSAFDLNSFTINGGATNVGTHGDGYATVVIAFA